MTHPIALDRDGRRWALLTIGNTMKARLVSGCASAAVLELDTLIDRHGPLFISSMDCPVADGLVAFADTVDLVASDPETASVEQIRNVAAFARSVVSPPGP